MRTVQLDDDAVIRYWRDDNDTMVELARPIRLRARWYAVGTVRRVRTFPYRWMARLYVQWYGA